MCACMCLSVCRINCKIGLLYKDGTGSTDMQYCSCRSFKLHTPQHTHTTSSTIPHPLRAMPYQERMKGKETERERWNSHPWFRSLRTLGKAGSYYHSKFAMCRVEEIRCVLPLKCIFQPLCNGKFHQVLEGAVIRGMGYECCCIKSRHLSNKMKHSQTPAKWKIFPLISGLSFLTMLWKKYWNYKVHWIAWINISK